MSKPSRAQVFRDLHKGPELLILPNAFDAGSARVIERAGANAIATSSSAVAWSHGYPDGEALPVETVLQTIREIARAVDVPVSADIEMAYARDAKSAAAFVRRVIDAGAVGINIEDGSEPPELLCAKIEAVREAAESAGVDLWINARTDVYLKKLADGEAAFRESVRRAHLYAEAGANSIFVPAAVDEMVLANLVREIRLPLNALTFPGLPSAAELQRLGIRRLSCGGGLGRGALERVAELATAFLADGRSEPFAPGELGNLNNLMRR